MIRNIFIAAVLVSAPLFAQNTISSYSNGRCWYDRLEVGADWLYWKAPQEQMEMAVGVSSSGDDASQVIQSNPITYDFDYNSGYRVYLNYELDNCWSFSAALTHAPSQASVGAFTDPTNVQSNFIVLNSNTFPIFTPINSSGSNYINSFNSTWNLDLYYLDLDIGKSFSPCNCLELGAYLGVRGYWMKQSIDLTANIININSEVTTQLLLVSNFNEKFYGAGLQGGVNGFWKVGCGFSLIGQFGVSLLYSRADINQHLSDVIVSSIGSPPPATIALSTGTALYTSIPTMDSLICLQYDTSLCNYGLEFHIGWENHLIFHINQLGLLEAGNLTMQGLTLGGSIRF